MPATDATVASKLTAIRSFFSYLQTAGYRGTNPAYRNFVDAPSMPDVGLTPEIPPSQIIALLDAPVTKDKEGETVPIGARDKTRLALLANMALRVEELHSINVGNIQRVANIPSFTSKAKVAAPAKEWFRQKQPKHSMLRLNLPESAMTVAVPYSALENRHAA